MGKTDRRVKITPTNERIVKGDIAFSQCGMYYSLLPTVLENWKDMGFLGSNSKQTLRISACEVLFELAEQTELMASNTVMLDRVAGRSVEEQPEISSIDHIRFILRHVSIKSSKILRDMIIAPNTPMPNLTRFEVSAAMDDLVRAIELWKESDLVED